MPDFFPHFPLVLLLVLAILLPRPTSAQIESIYPYRWVFIKRELGSDRDVNEIRQIAETASKHGFNGIVLCTGLDRLDMKPPSFFSRLKTLKQICDENHIEIIPGVFSVGYGHNITAHDKNLAVGFPVKNAVFVAKNGVAKPVSKQKIQVFNGGFEEYENNKAKGFFHDHPGKISFIDKNVFYSGHASMRFESATAEKHGLGRVWQLVSVYPFQRYRLSCRIKSENLVPHSGMMVQVWSEDMRRLGHGFIKPLTKATNDWTQVDYMFNSMNNSKVRFFIGVWGWKSGKFWIDDIIIERNFEQELINILRRPGTPLEIRNARTQEKYIEGKDFKQVADQQLNFKYDHKAPVIKIRPGGKIKNGDRLLMSYYHGIRLGNGQVSICMSEPKVYEIWEKQTKLIHALLKPKHYLLLMDEIRQGGTCETCKKRNMSMAEILGDCITKQYKIMRRVNPHANVFVWSDMLDPNHNARNNYYMVDGDLTGSWNYVPKDIIIACWSHRIRDKSLKHFKDNGFKVLAAAYYDSNSLDTSRGWIESMTRYKNVVGIMYTTWRSKYDLLADFGDMVSKTATRLSREANTGH